MKFAHVDAGEKLRIAVAKRRTNLAVVNNLTAIFIVEIRTREAWGPPLWKSRGRMGKVRLRRNAYAILWQR